MHFEEFAEGSSLFHRLDPRVKLVTFLPYVFVIALMEGVRYPTLALLLSVSMIILARVDTRKLLNRLVVANIFILFLWLFLPFNYPGRAFVGLGPFTATREGMLFATAITLKANAIILATIALLGTSQVFSLAHALVHLRLPDKLVHLFFFFYRYISVLHDEYTRLKRAMRVRAFNPGTNMHTYKTYAYLVGMLIVRSFDHSQRIYQAMLCRGFQGKFPVMSHFQMQQRDYLFGVCMFSITFFLVFLTWNAR